MPLKAVSKATLHVLELILNELNLERDVTLRSERDSLHEVEVRVVKAR